MMVTNEDMARTCEIMEESSIRFLLYSHDSYGLGHLRRTLAIAHSIVGHVPTASLFCLTGSPVAGFFSFPAQADYLQLPAVTKDASGEYVPRNRALSFGDTLRLRSSMIEASVRAYRPHVVLVDHSPLGMGGELMPALHVLRYEMPETRVVLGLRDVYDETAAIRSAWRRDGVAEFLEEFYDFILVYGQPDVYDVEREYELRAEIARKLFYTGYVYCRETSSGPAPIRQRFEVAGRPLVLVTVGGGEDGGVIVGQYIEGLASRPHPPWHSVIVAGPFVNEAQERAIAEQTSALRNVSFVRFTPQLQDWIGAADLVLSMGGYNTVVETLAQGKRAVVIPRVWPRREQYVRARRFEELGLLGFVDPFRMTPAALIEAVERGLAQPLPQAPALLDFRGAHRTATLLCELAGGARVPAATVAVGAAAA